MKQSEIYALYIMLVSMAVLGVAFIWLWRYDRAAQRAHDEWLQSLDQSRPSDRSWK